MFFSMINIGNANASCNHEVLDAVIGSVIALLASIAFSVVFNPSFLIL